MAASLKEQRKSVAKLRKALRGRFSQLTITLGLISELLEDGLRTKDIAYILELTPQRVNRYVTWLPGYGVAPAQHGVAQKQQTTRLMLRKCNTCLRRFPGDGRRKYCSQKCLDKGTRLRQANYRYKARRKHDK